MKIRPNDRKEMDTAPRDGTTILTCRNNWCGWDYYVVWWNGDCTYPWASESSGYPEDRLDYWQPLSAPYDPSVDLWSAA